MSVSIEVFRNALSRLAAGVSIITTAKGRDRRGVTATAVCSVSADPATILVCVNTNTGTCKMIEETGSFAVNLLAEHHRPVADVFSGRHGVQGDDRFMHGDWEKDQPLPVLYGALATIECRVDKVVGAGTHAVFFGVVEAAHVRAGRPLIYHAGRFQTLPIFADARLGNGACLVQQGSSAPRLASTWQDADELAEFETV